jgi:import inner membrane translocase subunit TIM16
MKKPMTFEEAKKILSLEEPLNDQNINEKFDKLFNTNSVENGGSFYIQSKIYNAKEFLLSNKK